MIKRDELTAFLDAQLKLADFSGDVSNNGLQVEGSGEVRKMLFAVDDDEKMQKMLHIKAKQVTTSNFFDNFFHAFWSSSFFI